MTVKDIKIVKTNRSIAFFGPPCDSINCDYCDKELFKDEVVHRAKVREGYCNTSVYICPECHQAHDNPNDNTEIFKEAFDRRGKRIGDALSNAQAL